MKFYDHVNHVTAVARLATCYETIFSVEIEDGTRFTVCVSKGDVYKIHYDPSTRTVIAHHPMVDYVDVMATVLETVIFLLTGEHAYLEEDE